MTTADEKLDLLRAIAAALENDGPVEVGTMFRSPGIRTGGKIVAFLGRNDRLIVKLPRDRALALIDASAAESVTMGTRTMREWVAIPSEAGAAETERKWTDYAREALVYARQIGAS